MFAPELSGGWRWFFLILAIVVIALVLETVSAVTNTLWRRRDEATPSPVLPPDRRPRDHETLRAAAGVHPLPAVRFRVVGLDQRRRPADPASVRADRDQTIGRDQFRGARARRIAELQGERR